MPWPTSAFAKYLAPRRSPNHFQSSGPREPLSASAKVIEAIEKTAKTGRIGNGKVFVLPVLFRKSNADDLRCFRSRQVRQKTELQKPDDQSD